MPDGRKAVHPGVVVTRLDHSQSVDRVACSLLLWAEPFRSTDGGADGLSVCSPYLCRDGDTVPPVVLSQVSVYFT